MFWKFCKFLMSGLFATAVHYSILVLLVELFRIHVIVATTAGFIISLIVNYACNRRFTFSSNESHVVLLPKFLTVALTGAAMNAGVLAWFEAYSSIHYLTAQLFATAVVLAWNFTINAAWTFRRQN